MANPTPYQSRLNYPEIKILADINLNGKELKNVLIDIYYGGSLNDWYFLSKLKEGQFFFYIDTVAGKKSLNYYDGSEVKTLQDDGLTFNFTNGNSLLKSNGTDGIVEYTENGIVKVTGGVPGAAVAENDYVSPNGIGSLTNKTIDADNNTISNIELDNFKAEVVIDIIPNSPGTSESSQIATVNAIRNYIETRVASVGKFCGPWDGVSALEGSGPNGAIIAGDYWRITVYKEDSVFGTVEAGDILVASKDDPIIPGDFFIIQGNVENSITLDNTNSDYSNKYVMVYSTLSRENKAVISDVKKSVMTQQIFKPTYFEEGILEKTFYFLDDHSDQMSVNGDYVLKIFVNYGNGIEEVEFETIKYEDKFTIRRNNTEAINDILIVINYNDYNTIYDLLNTIEIIF